MRLTATKEFHYNTRQLVAGDTFEASDKDGRLLVAIKKAVKNRDPGTVAPPPAELIAKVAPLVPALEDDTEALRAKAIEAGIDIDKRWGAKRLQAEIDAKEKAKAAAGVAVPVPAASPDTSV